MQCSWNRMLLFVHSIIIGLYSANCVQTFLYRCYYPCMEPYNYYCCKNHRNQKEGYATIEVLAMCCLCAPCFMFLEMFCVNMTLVEQCRYAFCCFFTVEFLGLIKWVVLYNEFAYVYVRIGLLYFAIVGLASYAYNNKNEKKQLSSQDATPYMPNL